MTALSILLPDALAKASQEAAGKLGISRTEFIRQAIAHELENLQAQLEEEAMAKSLRVMQKTPSYIAEAKEITEGLNTNLPDDEDGWWNKK